MIPGDFQVSKPPLKRLLGFGLLGLLGLGGLVVAALVAIFVISAWFGRPAIFGYDEGPDQPIPFNHAKHVQQVGLDCTFCHRNATKDAAATVPATGLCLTCHMTIGDGLENIENLRGYAERGEPINWVRVHRLPDHVQFVHEAHIRFFTERDNVSASEVCSTCHGDVGNMTKVKQVRSLKMSDCVDCHREYEAPTDCTTCHY